MDLHFIAHYRESDQQEQTVQEHLLGTSEKCGQFAEKIALGEIGELLGILHDLGKYSQSFQNYIQSGSGLLDPDLDDDYVDSKSQKGKIDHSTAGAQWVWQKFSRYKPEPECKAMGKMLAVCIASHHGGLIDCLKPDDGRDLFQKRIQKDDEKTHLEECLKRVDKKVLQRLEDLSSVAILKKFGKRIIEIAPPTNSVTDLPQLHIKQFHLGLLTRFLFSCLIDADRIDSADFEVPENRAKRKNPAQQIPWDTAVKRLNKKLATFSASADSEKSYISEIRKDVSDACYQKAFAPQGLFSLTVPTGGGKTLASMRFALHHAQKHNLDHIIYVIPYTSIIDQNAETIQDILANNDDTFPWVLEHHSNLEPEKQTWHSKLSAENWDAPIIFTTMVQFLEALFGGGTRGARRMHNLANSVIIFDEIQCLPVKCVHLFNNALNFLIEHCRTTAVLCTATQPLLNNLKESDRFGGLNIPPENEIIPDVSRLFQQLKRVEIINNCKPGGWSIDEITELICSQFRKKGNVLVIVNTKTWAKELYESCKNQVNEEDIFHLSTSLCPAHRKKLLGDIRLRLDAERPQPVLCISTQLIEAGVDVDFNVVIRFLAGLDSIAQAAGRCNRNGKQKTVAEVFVINPEKENISMLEDIRQGIDSSWRIFGEDKKQDFLSPQVMTRYFSYYFYKRAAEMVYPLSVQQAGRSNDNLFNLLSGNPFNPGRREDPYSLQQSFKTAGNAFAVIDAPTKSVIVPYGKGEEIIGLLCSAFEPAKATDLLKKAQQFSVNVFPHIWDKLCKAGAIYQVQEGLEIYAVRGQYYNENFGLDIEPSGIMSLQAI